jgi:hypothetical protein
VALLSQLCLQNPLTALGDPNANHSTKLSESSPIHSIQSGTAVFCARVDQTSIWTESCKLMNMMPSIHAFIPGIDVRAPIGAFSTPAAAAAAAAAAASLASVAPTSTAAMEEAATFKFGECKQIRRSHSDYMHSVMHV